jgi:hypothetical protein
MQENNRTDKTWTRREFLVGLGSIAGLTVTGVFFGSLARGKSIGTARASNPTCPVLHETLEVRHTSDGAGIWERGVGGRILCGVNTIGRNVLEEMNGRNPLQAIAGNVATKSGLDLGDREPFTGGIASFIIELGKMGLLQDPFYVRMMATEVRT